MNKTRVLYFKFLHDVVCLKLLKSVNVSQSNSKNKSDTKRKNRHRFCSCVLTAASLASVTSKGTRLLCVKCVALDRNFKLDPTRRHLLCVQYYVLSRKLARSITAILRVSSVKYCFCAAFVRNAARRRKSDAPPVVSQSERGFHSFLECLEMGFFVLLIRDARCPVKTGNAKTGK